MRGERPGGGYGNGAFPYVSGGRGGGQLLLQCNLNGARRAQDLMFQSLVERRIGLAAVAEHPRRVMECWGPNRLGCHILERERGKPFQLGDRAGTGLRGCEMGRPSRAYASFLNGLVACVRRLGACLSLVLGDFNAHSTAWGSRRTNGRGRDVQDWAAALDLRLMN